MNPTRRTLPIAVVAAANLLQINTASRPRDPVPVEGTLKVKVGSYLASEGFVVGKTTRLFLLNTDPKALRFPDGKTAADRAHDGTIDRIGRASAPAVEYLKLSPTARFAQECWPLYPACRRRRSPCSPPSSSGTKRCTIRCTTTY